MKETFMDSFYDKPRNAPVQRAPLTTSDNVLPTLVPDASMLQQNKGNVFQQRAQMSYNAWKVQQKNQPHNSTNKENVPKSSCLRPMQPSLYRKQVRFESPTAVSRPQKTMQYESQNAGIMLAQAQHNLLFKESETDCVSSAPQKLSDDFLSRQKGSGENLYRQKQSDQISSAQKQNDVFKQKQDGILSAQKPRENAVFGQKQNELLVPKSGVNILCAPNKVNNILQSKPFEKIYMANIPNRCLDLSIIEPPVSKPMRVRQYAESTHIEPKQTILDHTVQNPNGVLKGRTNDPLQERIHNQMQQIKNDPLQQRINNTLQQRYTDPLHQKISDSLQQKINDSLQQQVINPLQQKINDPPQQRISNFQQQKTNDPLQQRVNDPLQQIINDPLQQKVYDPLQQRINDALKQGINNPLQQRILDPQQQRRNEVLEQRTFDLFNKKQSNSLQQTINDAPESAGYDNPQPRLYKPQQEINNPTSSDLPLQSSQSSSEDPSVKDLLKIIQKQNEQLVTLQKQVNTLLQERNEVMCLSDRNGFLKEKSEEVLKNAFSSNNGEEVLFWGKRTGEDVYKNKLTAPNKFAIDVMTSFEVSIRPPGNFGGRKFGKDLTSQEGPKIKEIIEDDVRPTNGKKNTDVSLTLNEPLVVQEECPSPDNSIHIDMQDFSSSDSEEETSNHSSLIGWTIYNNVMDQVNFLIKKSQGDECQSKPNKFGTTAMQKVKEATLKHLKNVGVNLPSMDDADLSERNDSSVQYSPTEVSFAVKQLLMKYLPNEHLAKISEKNSEPEQVTGKYPTNLIKRRPDFSLATVQYMEKYNLLKKSGPKRDGKLLDITALKQQPKLL